MTHDQLYDVLLSRGYHEDFLDDASADLLLAIYISGRRDDDEDTTNRRETGGKAAEIRDACRKLFA